MNMFPYYLQYDAMDCGPTCLRMVSKHYGRGYTMDTLRQKSGINREGVSLLGISEAAEEIGFRTVGAKLAWEQLEDQAPMPCVVWWNQVHFVVVFKIKKNRVYVADPAKGKIRYSKEEFLRGRLNNSFKVVRHRAEGSNTFLNPPFLGVNSGSGIALLFYMSPKFYDLEGEAGNRLSFGILFQYILTYKSLLFQLALGLLAGSEIKKILAGSDGECFVSPCSTQYMCSCSNGTKTCATECSCKMFCGVYDPCWA